MLKRKVTQAEYEALSEAVRAFYEKDGDSWKLKVEADPELETARREAREARERVDEFRDNNNRYKRERDEARAAVKKAKKDKEGSDGEKSELEQSVEAIRTELNTEKEARQAAERRANTATLRDTLRSVGEPMGMDPTGLQDVQRRAEAAGFTVRNGEVVRLDSDGKPVKREGKPDTVTDWMTAGKDGDMALFFRKPAGGGDTPRGGVKDFGDDVEVLVNPTAQQIAARMGDISKGTVRIVHE